LSNFRIAYAQTAVSEGYVVGNFYNAQFVNCQIGCVLYNSTVNLNNALFANVRTNFLTIINSTATAQNATFNNATYLVTSFNGGLGVTLTNCILANVTNLSLSSWVSGSYNGFYNSPVFGTGTVTNTFYPFQSAGFGNYYLASGCNFTNQGTTNIDATLLTQLAQKTTYPPLVYTNVMISVATTLSPQVQRDSDAPDLGYHYDPLDYIFSNTVVNANLTFGAGTAAGWLTPATLSGGLIMTNNVTVTFSGTVTAPDYWAEGSAVQEGGTTPKDSGSGGISSAYYTYTPSQFVQARFTRFSALAADIYFTSPVRMSEVSAWMTNCEFRSGSMWSEIGWQTFDNCLFDRVTTLFVMESKIPAENVFTMGNCTMHGGTLNLNRAYVASLVITNCAFDLTSIPNNNVNPAADYNAYRPGQQRLQPQGGNDLVTTNFNWQTSWLGNYYLPNNSPLIDRGNPTADQVGLYHFTTQTNQVKETNSIVDIGYHYVAVNTNGNPFDADGDGVPDYLEDANGNGLVDAGETNWGLAILAQPVSQIVPQGTNVTFAVTVGGITPLSYQWYFNGTNFLAGATNVSLTLTNVQLTNAGNYSAVVTNLMGSLTSSNAVLTVLSPYHPSITTQPASQAVVEGGQVTFSVGVSGIGPFTYQWQLNGTNLPNDDLIITTVAGTNGYGYSGDGGAATNARLHWPHGVAVDAAGNLFIADTENSVIRKVGTNGIITTVAGGGNCPNNGDGGLATNACLVGPHGVAVDASGNLFIAETENSVIRKVDTNGIITTVAGNGYSGYSGDGVVATNTCLNYPNGVAVDGSGNLFIADTENGRIRKVDTNGIITTVAGGGNSDDGDGGAAINAVLRSPSGVAVDASGNLFIADTDNDRIRKVDTSGIITTVAGDGYGGYFGDGDAATDASLDWPYSVAVDGSGNLFIADTANSVIRKVDTSGIITTVAGDGYVGYFGDGGLATDASLDGPYGVAVDTSGNLSIADTDNNVIRKVTVSSLALFNVTANNAGNYTVIITSPYGSVTSSNAVLKVLMPPTITTQPTGQTASGGDTVTFTVMTSGSQPLFYQWRFNGTNILSATNVSLTLTNVQLAQSGSYAVLVSNVWGSTISSNAILVVRAPTVLSGLLTNYTFESDTTYYITNVQLYGVTTIEGGAIIKFAGQPAAQMTLNGPLVCLTGPSDMAILTSKDDNSVGEIISGSTGNPTNANSGTYLSAGSGQTNDYTFLRLAYAGVGIFGSGTVNVQDSQFVQCGTAVGCSAGGTVILMNNLFYCSAIANFATNLQSTLALSNNLVFGTTVNLPQPSSPVWYAFNNDFDTCTITNSTLTNGYNAYLKCNGRLYPTNVFDIVSTNSLAYQSGTLGNYYQPTNSPLIHKGSTTADQVDLYHYTVTTNQVVEGTNTVSIGYHYVATDAYGNPLDKNGDGIPDYLEDVNGNGLVNSGEIGWNIQGDLGLKVLITQPGNNSIIP